MKRLVVENQNWEIEFLRKSITFDTVQRCRSYTKISSMFLFFKLSLLNSFISPHNNIFIHMTINPTRLQLLCAHFICVVPLFHFAVKRRKSAYGYKRSGKLKSRVAYFILCTTKVDGPGKTKVAKSILSCSCDESGNQYHAAEYFSASDITKVGTLSSFFRESCNIWNVADVVAHMIEEASKRLDEARPVFMHS